MRNTLTRGAITLAAAASSIVFTGLQAHAEPVDHPATQPDGGSAAQPDEASAGQTETTSGTQSDSASSASSGQSDAASGTQSGEAERAAQPAPAPAPAPEAGQAAAADGSGANAESQAHGSPGILSGNSIQAPVHAPVNVCGNSVNVVGAANPAFGNECANGSTPAEPTPTPSVPSTPEPTPPPAPPVPQTHHEELAETGSEAPAGALAAAGAGVLLGGALLYRRGNRMPGQRSSS